MLNLSIERISIWFQNRRARFKKARKLETHDSRFDEAQYAMPDVVPNHTTTSTTTSPSVPYWSENNFGFTKSPENFVPQPYVDVKDSEARKFAGNYTPSYAFNQYKPVANDSPPSYHVPGNNAYFAPNLTAPLNSPFYQPYSK
jgi:hypothetical protein